MNNKLDKIIELSAWIITSLLLFKYVPKKQNTGSPYSLYV